MGEVAALNSEQITPVRFNPEQVELVKRTVAKGATDDELQMFLYLAQQYNLDPFAKEIWFIKRGDSPTIMTSRDGYLKIAQSHPDYMGLISFTVCEGDEFSIDAANYTVSHRFGAKRGKIIGAWARCDRKGRQPQICFVPYAEYAGSGPVWKQYPSAMIQKVAEVFVLKRQFTISGLVTSEEMSVSLENNGQSIKGRSDSISTAQIKRIFAIANNAGISNEQVRELMIDLFNKDSTKSLTVDEMEQLINAIAGLAEKENEEVASEDYEVIDVEYSLEDIEIIDSTSNVDPETGEVLL